MTTHEKVMEYIRFVRALGYERVDEKEKKGLPISEDDWTELFYRDGNSGSFYMLLKSIFPQAKPYLLQNEFVPESVYAKIGFRFYNISFDSLYAGKFVPVDEVVLECYRRTGDENDRFRDDIEKAQIFIKSLPEAGLTKRETTKIKKLNRTCSQVFEDVKPLTTLHCDFKDKTCSMMRKKESVGSCCSIYECQHDSPNGCLVGDEKPLFCKMFLCETVKRDFNQSLEYGDSELWHRYKSAIDLLDPHEDLLRKEWEIGLTD